MPVTQRPIKNSLCYSSDTITNTDNVIKDLSFRSLIGCITQLSELANKSSEVFSELVKLSTATNGRLSVLVQKTVSLSEKISSINIERSVIFEVEKGDHNSQSYTNTLQVPQTQRLADRSAMPTSMKSAYEATNMRRTPAFYELDTYKDSFMNGSKIVSIAHKYSNPSFFLNQWCLAQEARMRKIEAEREKQKEEKKVRRTHEPDAQDQDNRRSKKKNSISWQDRYSVNGQPVHRATERKSVSLPPTAEMNHPARPASEGGVAFGRGANQQVATETDDKSGTVGSGCADITSGNAADASSVNNVAPGALANRLPPLSGGLPPRKKEMGAEDVAPVKTVTVASKADGGTGHVRHVSFDAAVKSPDAVADKAVPSVSLKTDSAGTETAPPSSTSPLTVSRPNSSKTVDSDRLSTDSLSPSDFSHLESVADSDDDSDYDPSVDYRQDPQYNVHEPGTVDLADLELLFVSSVPLLRTNSVRSNATLRYSTVYKSNNVSTRIPPNQINKQQTEMDGDATPPMNGHLPTVPPPKPMGQHPTLSLLPPTASTTSNASDASPKVPSPKPPSPPPPPKLSPPPPVQKLSIFPHVEETKTIVTETAVNAQVATQGTTEQEKPAMASPTASTSTTSESTAQKSPPARVSPPPPPPPLKTNNSPPAATAPSASGVEGDAERPTSSIFSFFAAQPAPPAANKPVPPPPPPLGASPVPKNYLEDDDAAAFTVPIFKAAMPKPPPPPPPPSTNTAPAPSNHRQSQRLSQRLLVKSIRLSSTPSTQPAAFHIESERIPEEDEPPAVSEPPHLIIKAKDESVTAAAPPVLNIFAAIRRGSTLKKVDLEEETKKKQEHARSKSIGGFGDSSVAAILERRKFLEAESSGSDSDRDDDDWQ